MNNPKWISYLHQSEREALEVAEKAKADRDALRKRLKNRCEARMRADEENDKND